MAGLGPAIHDCRFSIGQIVDARHEAGHDELLLSGMVFSQLVSADKLQNPLKEVPCAFTSSFLPCVFRLP
jgi:hypothetical protein